jgi:hypothetical protein
VRHTSGSAGPTPRMPIFPPRADSNSITPPSVVTTVWGAISSTNEALTAFRRGLAVRGAASSTPYSRAAVDAQRRTPHVVAPAPPLLATKTPAVLSVLAGYCETDPTAAVTAQSIPEQVCSCGSSTAASRRLTNLAPNPRSVLNPPQRPPSRHRAMPILNRRSNLMQRRARGTVML